MSKRTDTNEASQFQGTLTVIASANPVDYGGGNIELEGALFTDIIRENTDAFGVDLEGVNFSDNYFTMTPITAPSNPPSGQQRVYVDIVDNLLKTKNNTGVVTIYQPLTTKGDLLTHNGTTQVTLPVGADGLYLVADSTVSSGIKWGNVSVTHSGLTGLLNDDHIQYALLAGRTGGQILTGGNASSNNLTIRSTSDTTKGSVIFDETTSSSSSTIGSVRIAGSIAISNTTDAVSSTNGGTITSAGGAAIAKKLFVGTDTGLATSSGITTIGSSTPFTISADGVLTINNTNASTSTITGSVIIAGGIGVSGTIYATNGNFVSLTAPHSGLTGLTVGDPHTQYTLLAGRSGGQILIGGTDANNSLTIRSTSNGTKGSILIDETTDSTSLSTGAVILSGGMVVTKKLQVGDTLNMNNNYITNVLNPINNNDAANKIYVDNSLVDLNVTKYVRVATVSSGTLASSFENGDTVDGITIVTGDRILIKNQVSGTENGIYIVQATGSPTRSSDFASGSSQNGVLILVQSGTENSGSAWFVSNIVGDDIVNTNSLIFTSLDRVVAGTGLTRTVNTLSVNNSLTNVTQVGTLSSLNVFGTVNFSSLTASQAVFTDVSKNLVSIGTNGTGNVVLTTSPTLVTPVLGAASGTSLSLTGTTDATSSTIGGTFTNAGGAAIAKKLFVGTDTNLATVSGITTIGSSSALTVSAAGVLTIVNTTTSTSNSTGAIIVSGGIGISNTTDAVSATNGGTITTAGGAAIAKKLFVGTDLSVLGITTLGSSTALTVSAAGVLTIVNTTTSTSNSTGAIIVSGGIGISNTTDAVSVTNGGTFTSAGGAAIAKKLFVGTDTNLATLSGITTIGSSTALTVSAAGLLNVNNTSTSTSNSTGAIRVLGGIGISNTTDAVSATNGGTFTTAGGAAIAKKLFVGTDLTVGGTTVFTSSSIGSLSVTNTTASTSSTTGVLLLLGGIGINNTTDAVSSTNGGTLTTAGGIAVAKKAFIGTDLSVGGTTLLSNYFQTVNITAPGNPPASNIIFYTDSTDSLLKSKNSSGTVTTYQPTTTKGDLLSHNGTTQVRVPVGLNNTYLIADSSQTAGIKWGNLKNIYYVYDLKTAGTNGGSSVSSAWTQRTLNTIVAYPTGTTKVTLSGSNMIFQPGVYKITASIPFSLANADIASRLYNVTNSTVTLISIAAHADSTNGIWKSFIHGIITVTSTTTFRIEYRTDKSTASSGLGIASGYHSEIYSHLEIELIEYNV